VIIAPPVCVLFGALEQRVKRQLAFVTPSGRCRQAIQYVVIGGEGNRSSLTAQSEPSIFDRQLVSGRRSSRPDQRRTKGLHTTGSNGRHREPLAHHRDRITEV